MDGVVVVIFKIQLPVDVRGIIYGCDCFFDTE